MLGPVYALLLGNMTRVRLETLYSANLSKQRALIFSGASSLRWYIL
jgi:hypothetical protein